MLSMIVTLFKSSTAIFTLLGGSFTFLVYLFGKSKAREEVKTEILKENIKNVSQQAQKVATIQQKQTKIASAPTPNRDDIHSWLSELSRGDKK